MATRRLGNLCADKTVFFLCDMQERFRNAIKYFPEITEVASRLVQASKLLNIPLIVTEQYPKGLGNTVSELDISHAVGTFAKTKFSMVLPDVEKQLESLCSNNVQHIVLFGIETHVCIQQTVIDLLNKNYEVHIVADACSSRSQTDRVFALERFRHMGATVTTSEAVLLQLIGDKDHPQFKAIQSLIMKSAPDTGLVKL
ncbi:Isochorismatase domain-containing protein 2A,Isochorismatase domain-containing protein 2B,Isochorismatase domain-containing protein 2,Isochorismatase domain-containing protein 1 [Mytilus coruscus]|uniref:Isochorismatase domain-containing protein 1 n=1 Tax=Mytilus coruscus TaxID=42192 RepID=A0A6J8EFT6_MYTCO|nr:Isochorismatase domain-containing protein 2A,Isochorismatase domain-containing protein 2B,Isochorismatase domain-containing protein 2,Isochorismatase domain-containing protein 1 [Mytilus coruscus]